MNEAGLERLRALLAEAEKHPDHSLTLAEYREAFADLPPPTDEQIEAFVPHVSHGGSWYKYWPRRSGPRVRLRLYLDPLAGYSLIRTYDGGVQWAERADEKQCFHYSELPTREHRRKFGTLMFLRPGGGSISVGVVVSGPGTSETAGRTGITGKWPAIAHPGGVAALPREVVEAGTALVNGLIHTRTGSDDPWVEASHPSWDQAVTASPDREVWRAFRERLQWLKSRPCGERPRLVDSFHDQYAVSYEADPVLHELLEPLRRPMRREMAEAMRRVRALVYD